MPAVTDLTWLELNNVLKQITNTTEEILYNNPNNSSQFLLNVSRLLDSNSLYLPSNGVLKALTMLLDAARLAQEIANTDKSLGEKLNSFPVPTIGVPNKNFVATTRTIVTRVDLRLAKTVVGTNI